MAKPRIVVAGAAGFIGRHAMRLARKRGLDAIGLTRRDLPGLVQVRGPDDLPPGDVAVHLAQQSHRGIVNERSRDEDEAEAQFTHALARVYPTLVLASTALVYGDRSEFPHTEDDPIVADDRYIAGKLAHERAVAERGGVIMRLTNIYGPGQTQSSVVNDLIARGRTSGTVSTQFGAPVRDFLYVEDAAAALVAAAERPVAGIFNVGTGHGTSIAELACTIAGLMNVDVAVDPVQSGSASTIIVDPRRAIEEWSLAAPRSLRFGLTATIGEQQ